MNQVFNMFGAMAMLPVMYSQALFTQALQWQREQADALTRLVASVTGHGSYGGGAVRRQPEDAELFVGKSVSHTKTLNDMHTLFFGLLSLDFNPLHFNDEMARRTRFGGRIAHGFHTASLFSGVLAELTPWCVYLHQEMDFTAPVRSGDVITATGTIEEVDEKGQVRVALTCTNQHNAVVVRGRAVVKKLKEMYQPSNPAA